MKTSIDESKLMESATRVDIELSNHQIASRIQGGSVPRTEIGEYHGYRVGVWKPDFCDQPYLRDHDIWVIAKSELEAVQEFIDEYKSHWLRTDEYRYIKVPERCDVRLRDDVNRDAGWNTRENRCHIDCYYQAGGHCMVGIFDPSDEPMECTRDIIEDDPLPISSTEALEMVSEHDDPPYSQKDYEEAKAIGLNLDEWGDYVRFYGLGGDDNNE